VVENLKNLDKVPREVKTKVAPFVEQLLKIHSDNIISIFLYGSSTGRNYIPKSSDINMVVVFKELDFSRLRSSLKLVNKGINKKICAPLFLTQRHIQTSLDVFPIEFLEMQENNVLVYGEDLLANLNIEASNIRFICEQQIKGKLIRIRQAYLEVGLKKKGIEALLKESLASLIPVFRNLLRLRSKQPSQDKSEMLKQFCKEFALEKDVLLPIYRDTRNDEKIAGKDVEYFLERYIEQLQKLAVIVDQL
jgi:predicted nucleotidyltransferase